MTAAAVRWFVRGVGTAGSERGPLHELVKVGPNEWRFGWVRPLRVLQVAHTEPRTAGQTIASRTTSVPSTIPTVRGQNPWWVTVEFWWRAPDASIEYPGMREGIFGRSYELNGADWVLDRAVIPAAVQADPGDQTWNQAQGAKAAEAAASAGAAIAKTLNVGLGVGALALIYLIAKHLGGR